MPLCLWNCFRANEEINHVKRQSVAEHLVKHKLIAQDINATYDVPLMKKKSYGLYSWDLLEKQRIMIYDNKLFL